MNTSLAKHNYRPWAVRTVVVRLSRRLTATYRIRSGRWLSHLLAAMLASFSAPAMALPADVRVVAGQATVSTPNANAMVVRQGSDKAILNWQSFNIGAGQSMQFVQPNAASVALNRVVGANPSAIYGSLSANGQVFLINAAGVMFAPGAQVNVGGLVASSLAISNEDFVAGRYTFSSKGGNSGSVVNHGSLNAARGGYVLLAAPSVNNTGAITTEAGSTGLAAGSRVSLDASGAGLVRFSVDAAAVNAVAANSGVIAAQGGQVAVLASALGDAMATVVNQTGVIRATSATERNGMIVLSGGRSGVVQVSGLLDASGGAPGQSGGTVKVLGDTVVLASGASIDASGQAGGGTVLIGGNYQGKGPEQNAAWTLVAAGASIDASAAKSGDGGKVVVWADGATGFYGSLQATGGAQAGHGGFAEVSGKQTLAFDGAANLSAANGSAGTLLLDPLNIVVSNAGPATYADVSTFAAQIGTTQTVSTGTLNAVAGNITLQATNDITLANAFTVTAGKSIRFEANNNININAALTTSGAGAINLKADADNSGAGTLALGGALSAQAGGITLSGASVTSTAAGTLRSTGAGNADAGNVSVTATGLVNLAAAITATGGTATAGNPGRAGGAVTISGVGGVTTAAISASGSNGNGAGQAGGNAGTVSVSNSGTGNIVTTALTAQTGNAVGAGAGGAAGSVTVSNTAAAGNVTTGAITTTGGTTGDGGNVSITAPNGTVAVGAIIASGGATGSANGRNAGTVNIAGADVTTAAVTTNGSNANTLGAGGNGGAISVNSTGAIASSGTLSAIGGNGVGASQAGGQGAAIALTSTGGNVSVAAMTATGGNAGATGVAAGGNAGAITLDAGGGIPTITLAGNLTALGGNQVGGAASGRGAAILVKDNALLNAATITVDARGGNAGTGIGANIQFDDAINSTGGVRSLVLQAGTGDVTASGAVGATSALSALTVTANDISVANIGGAAAGVTGATALTATTAGADAGEITFTGTTYNANAQTYVAAAGNTLKVNAGAVTTFTSTADTITFGNAASAAGGTLLLADGSNLSVNSANGAINAFAGVRGNSAETVSLNAGTGNLSVGQIGSANEVASVALSAATATLRGNITTADVLGNDVAITGAVALAGNVSMDTSRTINQGNITITGGTTGAGTGLSLTGRVISTGAINTTGAGNGDGGAVSITGSGAVAAGIITATGGTATAGNPGRAGGAVTISGVGGVTTAAISASGSNGNGAGQAGGNAGTVSVSNSGTGNIVTTALTAQTGNAVGAGAGGAAGSVTVSNTAAAGNVTTGAITTTGGTNGNGGNVMLSAQGNVTVSGTIGTSGGARGAGSTAGGTRAGNVTISGVDRSLAGAITASGGAALGANQAGGNAGTVTITGTGTLGTAGMTVQTGAATGAGVGGAAGSINLTGSTVTTGALTTTGGANGNGGAVAVTSGGALSLGATTANGGTGATTRGNVTLLAGGAITQTGAMVAGTLSATTASAGGAAITLSNAGNDTNTVNLQVRDGAPSAVGTSNLAGAAIQYRDANAVDVSGINNGTGAGGDVTLIAGGAITQTGAIKAGVTTLTAGAANNLTLNNAGNDFAGAVSVVSGNNVVLADANALVLGASTISGTLGVNTSGAITQSGALVVAGATTLAAGAGNDITLNNAGNNFAAVGITSGNNVSLRDSNALVLAASNISSALTVVAGGAITQTGAITAPTLSAKTLANAGATITLTNAGNNAGTVNLQSRNLIDNANAAGAISYRDASGFDVAAINTTGALVLQSNGNITQSGAATAASLAVTGTGGGSLDLGTQTNNIATLNAITAAGGFALNNGNNSVTAAGNITATNNAISMDAGSGTYTQNPNIDVAAGTGPITITADTVAIAANAGNNALTTSGVLTIKAKTANRAMSLGAGAGGFDLSTAEIAAIATGATGPVVIGDTASTGVMTIGAAVGLAGKTLTLNAGSISDAGVQTITASNVALHANGQIGTSSANGIDIAANNLSINTTGSANAFVRAGAINLGVGTGASDVGGGTLDLVATGPVTQTASTGNITAGTLKVKTLSGGTAGITLSNAGNDVATINLQSRNAADTANAAGAIQYTGANGFDIAAVATTGNAALSASSAVTQTGAVAASGLALTGTGGAYTLRHAGNAVTTVAASTGSMDYSQANALTVGTIGAVTGVTTTGAAKIETTDAASDLTLNAVVKSTASGNAVVLKAGSTNAAGVSSGGQLINNVGAGGIVASAGRYLVYSGDPGSTLEGVTGYSKRYNTAAGFAPDGSANMFLYRIAPTLSITAGNASRTYGQANPVLTGNATGFIDGDTAASVGVRYATTAVFNTPVAASPVAITAGATNNENYTLVLGNGLLTINPAPIADTAATTPAITDVSSLAAAFFRVPPSNSAPGLSAPRLTAADANALLESNPTAAGGAGEDAGSAYISVQTVREPTDQEAGIVWVTVASALVRGGMGFRFALPRNLSAQAAASAEPVRATTLAGQTLPAWLRYDPQAGVFVASAVPADALPLQVRVGIGKRSVVLTISEARGERAPQPKVVVERSPAEVPGRRG